MEASGAPIAGVAPSSLLGPAGNAEIFLWARARAPAGAPSRAHLEQQVDEALARLPRGRTPEM
jgi:hypothetical protein